MCGQSTPFVDEPTTDPALLRTLAAAGLPAAGRFLPKSGWVSRVIVDQGRVTGLIDFAEASAQPADVELDTILRWCAKAQEYPPTPDERGLDETTLTEVPGWLHGAYPELFEREHLRERLNFYDMHGELALYAHHPRPDMRETAHDRIALLLSGHNHLDGLLW